MYMLSALAAICRFAKTALDFYVSVHRPKR